MIKPYPYQEEASKRLFTYLEKNPGCHPLIGMPTGSGKTIVISDIINKTLLEWPDTKILILSHVKEILEQNHKAISEYLQREIGLYSSGLKSRSMTQITVAGIQSVWRHPESFTEYKFIIVDEAHLIPVKGEGMYRKFFSGLGNGITCLGLTATPYRLGSGYIYGKDAIFDDMIYDLTYMDAFNDLINDGYLCPVRTKHTELVFDTQELHLRGGEFMDNEMSDQFDKKQITEAAIKEIIKTGEGYKKWLIFAIDIEHAEHITESLLKNGVSAYIVHSKMETSNRDHIIQLYKSGELRALVNVNILTTGFDSPDIDLIALLRPTQSPVFHVQTIGRGLRVAPGKNHCLVLDFAGNTERLGPINDIQIRTRRSNGEPGEPITKTCPACKTIHHPVTKICEVCGYVFEFKTLLQVGSTGAQLIVTSKKLWHEVTEVQYSVHVKKNAPKSMKVTYVCGCRFFKEWVCIEHSGYVKHKADFWVDKRDGPPCDTVEQLMVASDKLKKPNRIEVDDKGKYPIITRLDFD